MEGTAEVYASLKKHDLRQAAVKNGLNVLSNNVDDANEASKEMRETFSEFIESCAVEKEKQDHDLLRAQWENLKLTSIIQAYERLTSTKIDVNEAQEWICEIPGLGTLGHKFRFRMCYDSQTSEYSCTPYPNQVIEEVHEELLGEKKIKSNGIGHWYFNVLRARFSSMSDPLK